MSIDLDNRLTGRIIGAAIAIHRALGPGLDEPVYEEMLSAELTANGVPHERQSPLPLRYKGVKLDCGYRIDLFVERRVAVELKSLEIVLPVHEAQLLTYLRLAPCELGLLINFDVPTLKQGVRRRIWTGKRRPPANNSANDDAALAFEPLSREVLAAAVEVHATLGPGLLRSTYEECLCYELSVRGIKFERRLMLPARFREIAVADAVEIRLLVCGELPVVCLSVPELTALHQARLLAQLRQGEWASGLLVNFNVGSLSQGIRRMVWGGEGRNTAETRKAQRGEE